MELSITASSTCPKIRCNSGPRNTMQSMDNTVEIVRTLKVTCLAASLLDSRSPLPRYWEQIIAAPAPNAVNTCMTSTLMESTRDTAEIAALPTLLTIMVSAIPIKEFKSCSTIIGRSSVISCLLENSICSRSNFVASYNLIFCILFHFLLFYYRCKILCITAEEASCTGDDFLHDFLHKCIVFYVNCDSKKSMNIMLF